MVLEEKDRIWAESVLEKITAKMLPVTERNQDKIPYLSENGVFDDWSGEDKIGWWTNGFWGGIMWQLYAQTGEQIYRDCAIRTEEKLDRVLMNWKSLDHDNGFKWLPTAIAHNKLEPNEDSVNRGLLAANNLLGRFNINGNFIRAWNDWDEVDRRGFAIIDCMMNLPLLFWASDVTGDPRFKDAAIAHANTAMTYFVRGDGSANHIVRFDPATGEMLEALGGQGYCEGSAWTRGQGWAIYGFTLSYLHTGDKRYLETARRVANYTIANIPENGLLPVDFRQPREISWEDSTAGAIIASGLIELSKAVAGREGRPYANDADMYLRTAIRLLRALDEKRADWSIETDPILQKCTAAYHDDKHEFTIIYGDYYFIEAIMKLTGEKLFIW